MANSARLWQLISPAFPIGAYSYSHGLEYAVDAQWVCDASTARSWIDGVVLGVIARLDVPVAARIYDAWIDGDVEAANRWNRFVIAARESAELRAEDQRMGKAMWNLLPALGIDGVDVGSDFPDSCSYVSVFACVCAVLKIDRREMASGYLWSCAENQVAAAVKLVPLGQTTGQKILSGILGRIPSAVITALALDDTSIGASAPGLAIASARHENQYARLFRS